MKSILKKNTVTVASPDHPSQKEMDWMISMLYCGLDSLWIRQVDELTIQLVGQIQKTNPRLLQKVLLPHSTIKRHSLSPTDIYGLHFSEKEREKYSFEYFQSLKASGYWISTSIHDHESFNKVNNFFDQVFISPLFDSISKSHYYANEEIWRIGNIDAPSSKIGLGGINIDNYNTVIQNGFDGAALLGYIWNNKNPLEKWKQFQHIHMTDRLLPQ